MAIRHQHLLDALNECGTHNRTDWHRYPMHTTENCGAREDPGTVQLFLCSRCRNARFCSLRCLKSYWPVHASCCRRHEMADALESSEPVFAAWMRNHGRIAQLKDSHVERLERAAQAVSGPGRGEVMETMYNRLDPTPLRTLPAPID